jgi:hypothetical protein
MPALDVLASVVADDVGRPVAERELADANTAGNPERARNAAQDLLEPATAGLLTAVDNLEEQRGPSRPNGPRERASHWPMRAANSGNTRPRG